jgi:CheY-like chemotaxis protein
MKGRILIIEDNELNLELTADLLAANDFLVWQARTAEEGLRLVGGLAPDLILMDLSLPGMDGLEATRALKGQPATRDLKVIALTAHAIKGYEEAARCAGCDGYVTKPIDTRAFPRQIADFLQ